jgi:hypothetical protein
LSGLGLRNFLFELFTLAANLNGELFDLKCELLDLGFVGASVLLECEVIFLFLPGCKRPLLQFLLVPVHLQLKLVHTLVGFKDHVLNVVQAILLVGNPLLQLFYFVLETPALTLGNLLHVFFSFNFFVFVINKGLSVYELHLH